VPKHIHRVGIHEAKTHLSRLLQDVENGGRPIARIVAAVEPTSPSDSYGMFAGQFTIADDFDADSEQLADLFGVAR
jgi:antitoxin (DNA-binding transcriptional repressor) of toxin-antitoxin stability system